MLTDDEKKRIREEEIFRTEVQQQLEAEKPTPSGFKRLLNYINMPFTLWLLSTIVIGILGLVYSNIQTGLNEQTKRNETLVKLSLELRYRQRESKWFLYDAQNKLREGKPYSPKFIYSRVVSVLDGENVAAESSSRINIFPEYQNRGYLSLSFELRQVAKESDQERLSYAEINYIELRQASTGSLEFQPSDDEKKRAEQSKDTCDRIDKLLSGIFDALQVQRQ